MSGNENDGIPINALLGFLRGQKPTLESAQHSLEVELRTDYFNFYKDVVGEFLQDSEKTALPPATFANEVKMYTDAIFTFMLLGLDGQENEIVKRAMKRVVEIEEKE